MIPVIQDDPMLHGVEIESDEEIDAEVDGRVIGENDDVELLPEERDRLMQAARERFEQQTGYRPDSLR